MNNDNQVLIQQKNESNGNKKNNRIRVRYLNLNAKNFNKLKNYRIRQNIIESRQLLSKCNVMDRTRKIKIKK